MSKIYFRFIAWFLLRLVLKVQWNIVCYRWKQYRSKTQRNVQHFLPASNQWQQILFVCDIIGNMAGSNKHCNQRRFEPSQNTGVKKMMSSELIFSLRFASMGGAASDTQNWASSFTFTKNIGSVTLQGVHLLNVISGSQYLRAEVTIFVSPAKHTGT